MKTKHFVQLVALSALWGGASHWRGHSHAGGLDARHASPLMKRAITRMQPLEIAAGIHAVSLRMLLPGAVWSWPQAHFTPGALAAMSPIFMIPVFGVTWGHLFLGEQLSTGIYAGGALVLLASALITGFNPWQKWLDVVDAKL